jgi:hypothetical protein
VTAEDHGQANAGERTVMMEAIRYGLPALVALAGLIVMCLGSESDLEGGAGILSAGLAIYFINWLFRVGVGGERERDAERSARDYFDVHGHWPDEPPGADGLRRGAAPPI